MTADDKDHLVTAFPLKIALASVNWQGRSAFRIKPNRAGRKVALDCLNLGVDFNFVSVYKSDQRDIDGVINYSFLNL
jgi:hypothetical protein